MAFLFHGNQKKQSTPINVDAHVVKKGYLAKKKSRKSRFYVLRSESKDSPARLECYESERKFSDGFQPKKKYILGDCFHIGQEANKNNLFVIALYIHKDCIALVAKNKEEMQDWLRLLQLWRKNSNSKCTNYKYVWPVKISETRLDVSQDLTGNHFLCLTNWYLSLVSVDDPSVIKTFHFDKIRMYGWYKAIFFLNLGRSSGIGSGELLLTTENSFTAQTICNSVGDAMSDFGRIMSKPDAIKPPRQRTISDPHMDILVGEGRLRSVSVPNTHCNNHENGKEYLLPFLEMIHQQPMQTSLNKTSCKKGDNLSNYLIMWPEVKSSSSTVTSPRSLNAKESSPISSPSDSSYTLGTPDSHIHDIAEDERGDTPHSGRGLVGSSLSPNYLEDQDNIGGSRRLRTNSVGSKPDQFKRKNSAPILGASSISHSWSGTPDAHFRSFIQSKNILRDPNLMELDFSKNKSYDYIPPVDKDKERKTNKERLYHTFTGHRHRSNSKSSVISNPGSKEKRTSESESSSRGLDIPGFPNGKSDYLECDFTPSPRSPNNDPTEGYLPMHPPSYHSSFLTSPVEIIDKRGPRTSLNEYCPAVSSSLSSCASNDGYVDMTRGESLTGALTIVSSSSSSNSINTPPIEGNGRKTHRTSCDIYTSGISSQELPSLNEDFKGEEIEACLADTKKSKKKGSKRRSFRISSKRNQNDSFSGSSPEAQVKNKSQGALATLTNLITRKANNNGSSNNSHKSLFSPKGSPLPLKVTKESTSLFSSLSLSKSKGKDLFDSIGEEREAVSFLEEILPSRTSPSPPPSPPFSTPKGEEKMLFSPLEGQNSKSDVNTEENRKDSYVNIEDTSCNDGSLSSVNMDKKRVTITTKSYNFIDTRDYKNMQPISSSPQFPSPMTSNSSLGTSADNFKFSAVTKPSNDYVMMGGESVKEAQIPSLSSEVAMRPEIPPKLLSNYSQQLPATMALFEKLSLNEEKPSLISGSVTENSRSQSGPEALEGTKVMLMNKSDDGRASSTCLSLISYSPPTSPTLVSVSSMSSLSESGLSSASSTCTVVNVGLKPSSSSGNASKSSSVSSTTTTTLATSSSSSTVSTSSMAAAAAKHPSLSSDPFSSSTSSIDTHKPSSSVLATKTTAVAASQASKVSSEDESLNYVALDLGNENRISSSKSSSPKLASKNSSPLKKSSSNDVPSSYVEMDFKKMEGLKNTSLERYSKRPNDP